MVLKMPLEKGNKETLEQAWWRRTTDDTCFWKQELQDQLHVAPHKALQAPWLPLHAWVHPSFAKPRCAAIKNSF